MPKPAPNTQTGSLTDHQHGTNDTLILADAGMGGPPLQIVLYGDAFALYDDSRGGNDTLIGEPMRTTASSATPVSSMTTPAAAMTR